MRNGSQGILDEAREPDHVPRFKAAGFFALHNECEPPGPSGKDIGPRIRLKGDSVMDKKAALLERFMRYAAIPTQSSLKAGCVPSNPREFDLARMLADELRDHGARRR